VVFYGIGHYFANAIDSRFQVESHVCVHSSLDQFWQLRVESVHLGAPSLGNQQTVFFIENRSDESYRVDIMLAIFVEMQRSGIQVCEQG